MEQTKDWMGSGKIGNRKAGSEGWKDRSRGRREDDAPTWLRVGLIDVRSAPGNGHYVRLGGRVGGRRVVQQQFDLLLGIGRDGTGLHALRDRLRGHAGLTGGGYRKLTSRAVGLTWNEGLRSLISRGDPTGHSAGADDGLPRLIWLAGAGPSARGASGHAVKGFGIKSQFPLLAVFFQLDGSRGEGAAAIDADDVETTLIRPPGTVTENGDPFLGFGIEQVDGRLASATGKPCQDVFCERVHRLANGGLGELKLKGAFAPQLLIAINGVFHRSKGIREDSFRGGRSVLGLQ
jgi:hypothetical protein